MASTDMSNTSDTNLASGLGQDAGALPPDAAAGPLGEPVDVVEVVEVQTYEPTPAGDVGNVGGPLEESAQTGMPWWLIPAIAVPVVAGATTGIVLLLRNRQKQQAPAAAASKLAKQSRDWLENVRNAQAMQNAMQALQQGVQSVRSTAQGLPDQAASLRDRSGDWLGGIAASDAVKSALDSVTSFWNTNAPQAKRAVKEQGRGASVMATPAVAAVLSRLPGNLGQDRATAAKDIAKAQAKQAARQVRKAASKASDRADKITDAAKPAVTAAAVKASAKAAKAAVKTNRAAKRAGKRANRAFKRTRAFTFGMLVAAIVTYTRQWRQRLLEKQTRETAGGRLVRDA